MVNAEKLITEHLEVWAAAVRARSSTGRRSNKKLELYGIRKLRGLILDLAVQGKLVPQNLKDQHADDLIKDVKESLPNKKSSNPFLREIGQEVVSESNYDLPRGWAWLPLGNIGIWATGCGFPKKFQGEIEKEFLFCKVSDMNLEGNEVEIRATANTIDSITLATIKGKANPIGTIIFPKIGGAIATHKRRIICKPTLIDNNCSGIQPIGLTVNRWLLILMQSLDLTKYQSGTSVPAVSQSTLDPIRVGIPPLAEQHRIVAKVDELTALCDQLEEEQGNNLETHETLVRTLLNALTSTTADASDFADAWQRIQDNFDILFTTESSVDQLKQTILQLAVIGKLVPQDPEDEPGNELLKRITASKIKLINTGLLKRQKTLPPVSDEEKTYAIPENWAWTRLNDAFDIRDGTHDSPQDAIGDNTYPLITSKDFKKGKINFEGSRRISSKDHFEICERSRVEVNDILFSMIGGNIGNQVIVEDPRPFSIKNVALFKYYNSELTSPRFLKIYSEELALKLQQKASGGAQPFVSLGYLRKLLFALPPLSEQHRIVAKVDELMALCEQLKANLATAQITQLNLADSLVEQAIK
jgi:type I restriction enzyme S subunit